MKIIKKMPVPLSGLRYLKVLYVGFDGAAIRRASRICQHFELARPKPPESE